MINSFSVVFQDPILMVTGVFFLVAAGILLWALKELQHLQPSLESVYGDGDETFPAAEPEEESGILEARLLEVSNQLRDVGRRMGDLEKTVNQKKPMDQTFPVLNTVPPELAARLEEIKTRLTDLEKALSSRPDEAQPAAPAFDPAQLEKLIERLETRPAAAAPDENAPPFPFDTIARIEAKLEGIHKLLILLTDSGNPNQE